MSLVRKVLFDRGFARGDAPPGSPGGDLPFGLLREGPIAGLADLTASVLGIRGIRGSRVVTTIGLDGEDLGKTAVGRGIRARSRNTLIAPSRLLIRPRSLLI